MECRPILKTVTQSQSHRDTQCPLGNITRHHPPLTGTPLTAPHTPGDTPHGHPGTSSLRGHAGSHSFAVPFTAQGRTARSPSDPKTHTHCPRASQCSNTHVPQHTQPRGCADTHRHIKERTRRLGTHGPTDRDGTAQTHSPANAWSDSRADRFGGPGVPKRTPRTRTPPTRADRTPEPSSAATDARGPGARGAEIW